MKWENTIAHMYGSSFRINFKKYEKKKKKITFRKKNMRYPKKMKSVVPGHNWE